MKLNLNNLKINNPFGKFLKNIFLGVILLLISFSGVMISTNLIYKPVKEDTPVDAATNVAQVGSTYFTTFKAAVNYANTQSASQTIRLLSAPTSTASDTENIIIANDISITANSSTYGIRFNGNTIGVLPGCTLTINSGYFYDCQFSSVYNSNNTYCSGTINIQGGTFSSTKTGMVKLYAGNMTISGGTFGPASSHLLDIYQDAELTISKGTFTNSGGGKTINTWGGKVTINGGTFNCSNNDTIKVDNNAILSINGGTINGTNPVWVANGQLKLKGSPSFNNSLVYAEFSGGARIDVVGSLTSNIKISSYTTPNDTYIDKTAITFDSSLSSSSYLSKFTLQNGGNFKFYADSSTNTIKFAKHITVTYKALGGESVTSTTREVRVGGVYGNAPSVTVPNGYYLTNWTDALGNEITSTTKVAVAEDHTLYAYIKKSVLSSGWWAAIKKVVTSNWSSINEAVTEISFVSTKPTGAVYEVNIGRNDDDKTYNDSIKAYYIASGSNYIIKIYSPSGVITAPEDCVDLFASFISVRSINFNNLLNTDNVTRMDAIFAGDKKLTSIDLTSLNLKNVNNLMMAFAGCESLTTIKGLETLSVLGDISFMFSGCSALTSVDLSNMKFGPMEINGLMSVFKGCTSLKTLDLSSWDLSYLLVTENDLNGATDEQLVETFQNLLNTGDCTSLTEFRAPYGKSFIFSTLPSGFYSLSTGTTTDKAYFDGSIYVKGVTSKNTSVLNKDWFNIVQEKLLTSVYSVYNINFSKSVVKTLQFKQVSEITTQEGKYLFKIDVSSGVNNGVYGTSEITVDYDQVYCYLYYTLDESTDTLNFDGNIIIAYPTKLILPTDSSTLFSGFSGLSENINATNFDKDSIDYSKITNASNMFSGTKLYSLNLSNANLTSVNNVENMMASAIVSSSVVTPKSLKSNVKIKLPTNHHWYKNDINKKIYDEIDSSMSAVNLTACYTVYLISNGGEQQDVLIAVEENNNLTLSQTFTRVGYTFSGYATSSNGAVVYSTNATISNINKDYYLYVVWTPITYKLAYTLNGGTVSGVNPTTASYDEEFTIIAPTKDGYDFVGFTAEGINPSYARLNRMAWDGSQTRVLDFNFKNLTTTNNATITLVANYKEKQGSYVVRINQNYFASLLDAVNYANSQYALNSSNNTFIIYLLNSKISSSNITINSGVTLNLVPQTTGKVQFEIGTGRIIISSGATLTIGYDSSNSYKGFDNSSLTEQQLSGGFTLSSSGTAIENNGTLNFYNGEIVGGEYDIKNLGTLNIKGTPKFSKGIYADSPNKINVTGSLVTISVPVGLNATNFKANKDVIINFGSLNANSYANMFNISNIAGFGNLVTQNTIELRKLSKITYNVDGTNLTETGSYLEGSTTELKNYSKSGYRFYGWYKTSPTGDLSNLESFSKLTGTETGNITFYGKTILVGGRNQEGYADSTITINVNADSSLSSTKAYGIIIVEFFDADLGITRTNTYGLKNGTIILSGLRYGTYKITVKTTLKVESDVISYAITTSSKSSSTLTINLSKQNIGGIIDTGNI